MNGPTGEHRAGRGIRFGRPDTKILITEGYRPADMHFHTSHTDGTVGIPELKRRIDTTGIGCAVTDHNEVSGALAACTRDDDSLIIPGIEISTVDGPHILVYFYEPGDLNNFYQRYVLPNRRESPWMLTTLTVADTLEAAEGFACLRGAAHPYGYFMFNGGIGKCIEKGMLDESLYGKCDLIEGICANMAHRENLRAISLASRLGLPMTGGSDGHVISDLGTAVTCTRSEDRGEFLDQLRTGKAFVIGREKHLPAKIVTAAAITARFMPWFYPSLKIHCERTMLRISNAFSRGR